MSETGTNRYEVGSIVWAKVLGYPWWPAMVDHDPDTAKYVWMKEGNKLPSCYHVVFLGEDVNRSWVEPNKLKEFIESKTLKEMGPFVVKGKDHREAVKVAIVSAMNALEMNIKDRIQKYSFLSRYKGEKSATTEDGKQKDSAKKRKSEENLKDVVHNEESVRLYSQIKEILDDVEQILNTTDDLDSIYDDPDFKIASEKSEEDDEDFEMKSKRKRRKKNGSSKTSKETMTTTKGKGRKGKKTFKDAKEKENVEGGRGEVTKRKRGRPTKKVVGLQTNGETSQEPKEKTAKKIQVPSEKKVKKMKPTFKSIKKVVEIPKEDEEEVQVLISAKKDDENEKIKSSNAVDFEE